MSHMLIINVEPALERVETREKQNKKVRVKSWIFLKWFNLAVSASHGGAQNVNKTILEILSLD